MQVRVPFASLVMIRLFGAGTRFGRLALATFATLAGVGATACAPAKPEGTRYYERHVQPVFDSFCVGNTSPCHRVDKETGVALGNLDLSSFDAVQKRRDVLRTYGSYPYPLLLLKAIPESDVFIPYQRTHLKSEIVHSGAKPLRTDSDAFFELKRWLDNGATRDGVAPAPQAQAGQGACNRTIPTDRDLASVDTSSTAYQLFATHVGPRLQQSCAFATCHSSPQSDFYVTCGETEDEQRFNFLQSAGFVSVTPDAAGLLAPPEQSELLLRPLDPAGGGVSHTGGSFFHARTDPEWLGWREFAVAVQMAPPAALARTAGQRFFEDQVMPLLLRRGCALEGCHSPNGFNDYRLRPGAQGFFAASAQDRNYHTTLDEFMALDTVDVRQSRIVKKNIVPAAGGIVHRGGALLETPGFDTASGACPTPFDAATASAFCVLDEWHRLERQARSTAVTAMTASERVPLAFVARPPDGDSPLAFDTFRGGADLLIADATLGPRGHVMSVANPRSALGGCSGLAAGAADVRGPEWSYDGRNVVFAARPSAASGLDLWMVEIAASGAPGACRRLTNDDGRMAGAVRVHNFDPVFAPDGSVVFASTRAGTLTLKTSLPNADLFRSRPAADFGAVEQMTWLLNSELAPAFMQDGRVTFTAEKATPDFYQLAGRRINWDLSDYHPLLAQRATSTDTFNATAHPSVGYAQATEIREALDRNFLLIVSDEGALGGGGALATFNRSVGPFQADRASDPRVLPSMHLVDPAATGRDGTTGVYRSPFSLPDGEILASYAANVRNPAADVPKYDLVALDPRTGARRALLADPARSFVEATLGYKRAGTLLFRNSPQLVFGGHVEPSLGDAAIVHFPDLPLLATLLDANLRLGRNVKAFDAAVGLRVYEVRPPAGPVAPGTVHSERVSLGTARVEADRSLKVQLPAKKPVILELVDSAGNPVFTMREEHQLGPGETITPGPPRKLFDGICGGCHGSITGNELDISVTPDALTGASVSLSRDLPPKTLQ